MRQFRGKTMFPAPKKLVIVLCGAIIGLLIYIIIRTQDNTFIIMRICGIIGLVCVFIAFLINKKAKQ